MNIWITLSEKAFKNINCDTLKKFDVECLRINICRERDEWILSTLASLNNSRFETTNIYLDIGNNKPRIILNLPQKELFVDKEDRIIISKGNGKFQVSDITFFQNLLIGNIVIFGDGLMEFELVEKKQDEIILRALSSGMIRTFMSLYVAQSEFSDFKLNKNEIIRVNAILKKFPISLMLSFVQHDIDVINARSLFPDASLIVPKIETFKAYNNFENICLVSEKIVFGRGDLGLSAGIEKIGVLQNNIIVKAKAMNKPFIIATETLESFTFRPYPFRSEVIDITNSYFNGAEAILLTSETASLENPFLPISFLRKTIDYLKNNEL